MGAVAAHMREIDQAFTALHASHDAVEAELAVRTQERDARGRENETLRAELAGRNMANEALKAELVVRARETEALKAEVAGRTRETEALRAELGGRAREIDSLGVELAGRVREVDELRARVADLQRANQELAAQLDGLTAERLRGSREVSSADNFRHQELADRLATFVKQDLPALLQPLAEPAAGPAERQYRAARRTAQALDLLLREGVSDGDELLRGLDAGGAEHLLPQADRVCAIADALHDTTVELDNPEGWLLDASPGRRLDPRTQQPWGPCDPDAPIEFTVVPGYTANGRTYFHQLVFTRI
jgi:hypothetical protein